MASYGEAGRAVAMVRRKRALSQNYLAWAMAGTALGLPATALAQEEEPTALKQIVVTASGFEQNVTDAPASITVISREQLELGKFRDLTDALRDVQGVSVTGVANEKDIYIRGLPGS